MATIISEPDQERLLATAGRLLCSKLQQALASRGRAVLAVPGGRAVARVFQAMVGEDLDWRRIHVVAIDERLVPRGHPDHNFGLVEEHLAAPLLCAGRMAASNLHPFVLDPTSPDRGVARYERELAACGLRFDVALLSAGEDGHVAALFPGHPALADGHLGYLQLDDSPKPPPERMTASLPLLASAGAAVLLVVGEAKRAAFSALTDPRVGLADCPAKLVLEVGDATVVTDLLPPGGRAAEEGTA